MAAPERTDGTPGGDAAWRAWFSLRRKRCWAWILLLAYALAGFVVAPWILARELPEWLSGRLQRPVELADLKINPFALSVEATGFAIRETDGATVVSFDRLFANLQLASVWRRALVLRDFTLERPFVNVIRAESGAFNVLALADSWNATASPEPAEPDETDDGGPFRAVVQSLALIGGGVDFTDRALETDFQTRVGPVEFKLENLSTLPEDAGRQQVSISTERGAQVQWSGDIQLQPLYSAGRVTGSGPYLPALYQYFQDQLAFEVSEGDVELSFDYRVELPDGGTLSVMLDNVLMDLRGLRMRRDGEELPFLELPQLELSGGRFLWPEQELAVQVFSIAGARLQVVRDADGILNLQRLVLAPDSEPVGDSGPAEGNGPPAGSSAAVAKIDGGAPPQPADDPLSAWDLRLGEFRIDEMAVGFEDRALRSPASVDVRDITLKVTGISNQPGELFPFEASLALDGGGAVRADGHAGALPQPAVEADVEVRGLALELAQPYLADTAQVALTEGALDADVKLSITADESLGAVGQLSIAGLEISDTVKDERLVGWRKLDVDRFQFSQTGNSLAVSEVKASGPYVRLLIDRDGTTNFQELTVDAPPAESPAPQVGEPLPALAISVGRITVADGSSDFADLSLPIPFGTKIADLNGQIATLATTSTEPADVNFEGRVGEFGLARIEGVVSPAAPAGRTDVKVLFRNVELPDLSPYTVKFAGRKIDEGRLDLNLEYLIDEGQLQGANSVVIDQLKLGEKVDYPGAADLPLGLAVALLTGPDGTIDLDLPITGDVNDPEFSIGAVVFKVFANLITKAATAPFKLLGALVGVESENFDRIEFTPGRADLEPPEQEKLLKLAEALGQRPELGLRVGGVVDPDADADALREARVDAAVTAGIDADAEGGSREAMLLERRRSVLEDLFAQRFPGESADTVAAGFMVPADPGKPDGKQVLDEPAYLAALRARLVAAETITAEDLDVLARARAQAVIDALVAGAQIEPARISAGDAGEAKLTDDGWIPMKLEAAGLGGG